VGVPRVAELRVSVGISLVRVDISCVEDVLVTTSVKPVSSGVRLVPMPTERLAAWIASTNAEYLQARLRSGERAEEAARSAARSLEELFPGGQPLPTHHIFDIVDDATTVGYLWIGPTSESSTEWWVWDVEVLPQYRRRGFARAALTLGDDVARRMGAKAIGLNVFGYNTGAQELYESLGYEVTAVNMRKKLGN
jgi:ribosomal protein S18 acetylase RimI-like enzyme